MHLRPCPPSQAPWASLPGYPVFQELAPAVPGTRPGWYRLCLPPARGGPAQRTVLACRTSETAEILLMALPLAVNNSLDHVFRLPLPCSGLGLLSRHAPWPGEAPFQLHPLHPFHAHLLMAARLARFLRREWTPGLLARVDALGTDPRSAFSPPASALERLYQRIKNRMLLRSVPLPSYAKWKAAIGDRALPDPGRGPRDGTAASLAVIILADESGPASALDATMDSIARQSSPPEEWLVIGGPQDGYNAADGGLAPVHIPWEQYPGPALTQVFASLSSQWLLLPAPGDVLHPDALAHFRSAISAHPHARCIYCDEELPGPDGLIPLLKPDFDPLLQLSSDYVGRACALAADHVRRLAPPQGDTSAEIRLDLVLGATMGDPSHVAHLRLPLVRSTNPGERFHFSAGQLRLLDRHARACLPGARIIREDDVPHARLHVSLTPPAPEVSIIIPTRDRADLLRPCVESMLKATEYPGRELIIVDNGSREQDTARFLDSLRETGAARIIRSDMPFNYSSLNNLAAKAAGGSVLAFLNNDVEAADPRWLMEMVSLAMLPDTGSVGAKLLYPDGRIQHAGIVAGLFGMAGHMWKGLDDKAPGKDFRLSRVRTVTANTGACLVVRKDVFLRAGGFDKSLAVAFNDVDLCFRLDSMGLRNLWTPHAVLVHRESATRGSSGGRTRRPGFEREKRLMRKRWGARLAADPWHHPFLARDAEDGGLALSPRTEALT